MSGLEPKHRRLIMETCLRIVMGKKFGLGLRHISKLCAEDLGNALMIILFRTAQERLIRGFLNQSMFKYIGRLGRKPPLTQQLRRYKLLEVTLQRRTIAL